MRFSHRNLKAYQRALEFIVASDDVVEQLPPGRGYIAKQLRRAAFSIVLNIAEGYGEFSRGEKARFYRMARRSATECAACLDVCLKLELVSPETVDNTKKILVSVLKMLVGLIKRHAQTDAEDLSD